MAMADGCSSSRCGLYLLVSCSQLGTSASRDAAPLESTSRRSKDLAPRNSRIRRSRSTQPGSTNSMERYLCKALFVRVDSSSRDRHYDWSGVWRYQRLRSTSAKSRIRPTFGARPSANLRMLASDPSPANLPIYLKLLDNDSINAQVIPMLSRYDQEAVADRLLDRIPTWTGTRIRLPKKCFAAELLGPTRCWIESNKGKLDKSQLTAYFARQMSTLGDAKLMERLTKEWGTCRAAIRNAKRRLST